jgi:hypothetical protein
MNAPHDPRQLCLFPHIDLETLHRELCDARQEARNLTVMAMNPKHPPETAELLKLCERSARAQVTLLIRAIDHAQDPKGAAQRFAARRRR